MVINERDAETLRNVRRLYHELLKLRKDLEEMRCITLCSPCLDGMPRGGGHEDKMIDRMIRIESIERREAILVSRIKAARVKAYQACRRMTSVKARVFFEACCADLQPVETAQKISGVDDQTVREYLKMLKEDR